MIQSFTPGPSGTLAVTATSVRLALTGNGYQVYVHNAGDFECFVAFGGATVTAVAGGATTALTGSMSIPPGAFFVLTMGEAAYIAAVCSAGNSTTLRATRGDGS